MTALPSMRPILNNTPADAVDVDYNFGAIASHISQEMINRDGSVSMTGPLTLAGPPSAPNHATTKQYVDNNIPAGTIWMFAGATPPNGWVVCDGASKSTTDPAYAALFAAIQYAYGGSGANFNLPNLKGRVPVGLDTADASFNTLGKSLGSKIAKLVTHFHTVVNHTHDLSSHTHAHAHTHDTDPITVQVKTTGGAMVYGSQGEPASWSSSPGVLHGPSSPGAGINGSPAGWFAQPLYADVQATTSGNPSSPSTQGPSNNSSGGAAPATDSKGTSTDGANSDNLQPYLTVNYIVKL